MLLLQNTAGSPTHGPDATAGLVGLAPQTTDASKTSSNKSSEV